MKWVFQSKKPASRRASQPPFWRISQLDRAVGPPSPCSSSSTFAHQAQTAGRANALARLGRRASQSSIQILDHFLMAAPSPPHRAPAVFGFTNTSHSLWPGDSGPPFDGAVSAPSSVFWTGANPTPSVGPESMPFSSRGECTDYFKLPSLPTPFLRSYRLFLTGESPSPFFD